MPKYRSLHTKILNSDDFNAMPDDFTRLIWTLLPLILDREGRGLNDISWIKSNLFPRRVDYIDNNQLRSAFDWFADPKRKMVIYYEVHGHKYFYIPTFKDYQYRTEREAPSVIPSPPENSPETTPTPTETTPELLRNNSVTIPELGAVTGTELGAVTVNESVNEYVNESVNEYVNDSESVNRNDDFLNLPIQENGISPNNAWRMVLDQLQCDMPRDKFEEVVKKTELINYDNGLFMVGTETDYQADWIRSRLKSKILRLLCGICNRAVNVEFTKGIV
jgi:hypothetical protein